VRRVALGLLALAPACALALAAPPAAAPAGARELEIRRFHADVRVEADGDIEVQETILFRFTGAWNGVIRDIPVRYRTPQGFDYDLRLDVRSVTGADGAPLRHESRRERHDRQLRIWVPDAVDADRAVVLRYRVANALRFFSEHDELYWNVTGDEWEMPIAEASARVILPAASRAVRATAYSGPYGSVTQEAEIVVSGAEVAVRLTRPLGFREGLTAVVGWSKGAVRPPGALARARDFLAANGILLLPVLAFGALWLLWRRVGRDPAPEPEMVRFEPPAGLSPAEAGALLDHSVDTRDIVATLVDLAARGFLAIHEEPRPGVLGFGAGTDHVFECLQPPESWTALKPHEQQMLRGLFGAGAGAGRVRLAALKDRFAGHLDIMREGIYESLCGAGYYRVRPDRMAAVFYVLGGLTLLLALPASRLFGDLLGISGLATGLAVALTGGVLLGFGTVMPARTVAGARAVEAVRGFREFLSRVERDRFERVELTPAMFERFLAYAMAFGVEDRWAAAFAGISTEPPRWYQTTAGGRFDAPHLGRSLGDFTHRAAAAMTSRPRGSGVSGFGGGGGGGGRSGGGFGGGGGRGF
jgi:hypothetical protein